MVVGFVIILLMSWLSLKLLVWFFIDDFIDFWNVFSVGYLFFWFCVVFGGLGWFIIYCIFVKMGEIINVEILDDGL